jgi:hypothetical protein
MIRNKQDFWSGILYLSCGVFFATFATGYTMGTAAKMGPGYFPFYLGILLGLIGAYIVLTSVRSNAESTEVESFDFRTIGLILGAVTVFGLLLNPMGLFVALFALILISGFASHEFSLKETLINAAVLITSCYLVFIKLLNLQFPLFPKFLGL